MKQDCKQISVIVVDDDHDIVSTLCDLFHIGGRNIVGVRYNGKEENEEIRKQFQMW